MDDGAAAVHGYGARLLRPLIAHVSCSCSAALCLVIRSSLRPVVCPSVCVNEMMERGVRCVCAPWSGLCALVPTHRGVCTWVDDPRLPVSLTPSGPLEGAIHEHACKN